MNLQPTKTQKDKFGNKFEGQVFTSDDATFTGTGIMFTVRPPEPNRPGGIKIGELVMVDGRVWKVAKIDTTGFTRTPVSIIVHAVRKAWEECATDWLKEKIPDIGFATHYRIEAYVKGQDRKSYVQLLAAFQEWYDGKTPAAE